MESPPTPGTPQEDEEEQEYEEEEEEEEEEYEEPRFDREELIERYHVSVIFTFYFCNVISFLASWDATINVNIPFQSWSFAISLLDRYRYSLLILFQQALAEREQIQQQNHQLQHKLAEYFRKKKSDDNRQDVDKNVTDQEQRYLKYMGNVSVFLNQPV